VENASWGDCWNFEASNDVPFPIVIAVPVSSGLAKPSLRDAPNGGARMPSYSVAVNPQPFPIGKPDRVGSLDALRGVALLGILLVNIFSIAQPHYSSPNAYGDLHGANFAVWLFSHTFAVPTAPTCSHRSDHSSACDASTPPSNGGLATSISCPYRQMTSHTQAECVPTSTTTRAAFNA
jgi:hypothetical protein